ncbi:MAG TPA: ATP-binding protein [Candidatus Thermoplasmatota archaeon]|nr:ATP-binding protein [Candidatus Thermoplasmatota archaeon]
MKLPEAIEGLDRGRVVGVLGMPGVGKTEDAAQIVARSNLAVLALDPVGVLSQKLEGADVYLVHVPRQFNLAATWDWTRDKLYGGEKVVWDLKEWRTAEIQKLADAMVPKLKTLRNCVVVVDEVQKITPDFSADMGRGAPDFKDWLTVRRNQGVSFVWTSQRPAFVSMTVRGLTDAWLVHRLFYANDREVIKNLLKAQPDVDVDELESRMQNFQPGDVAFIDLPFLAG